MTLNSLLVARWTRTALPLGAPAISSAVHWPATVVHPARVGASKSTVCDGTSSGSRSSGTAALGRPRLAPTAPSAASAVFSTRRRAIIASPPSPHPSRAVLVHGGPVARRQERADEVAPSVERQRVGPRLGGDGVAAAERRGVEDLDQPG